ncbi:MULTISPECIES: hypothetical protein [Cyanophyceae]|uniref:Uncharacterized protein n=1 Tax=Leptolyngbya subtilissima DQ-A4 TaxID=2933933 RepID=A0ABV0K0D9_9CYAN|nr:hypothetical protein [Nodosilinea sp. FACHB-141]MBD2110938.1 hypothetical protein [Nodosilinea sp. FACHB-141]
MAINCAVDCKDGCVLGNDCPNLKYTAEATKFISDTSLDEMLEMADEAVRRRMMERASQPPKWVLPED